MDYLNNKTLENYNIYKEQRNKVKIVVRKQRYNGKSLESRGNVKNTKNC